MGLLDTLAGEASKALSGTSDKSHPGLMDAVTGLIRDSGNGGLSGLIAKFQQGGLGDAVASWISTGRNLPITGEQLQSVLGNAQVQAIAQKLGLSTDDVAHKLAGMLPQAIDHLTQNGQVPSGGIVEQGLAFLQGMARKA
jgi:uncharacterized protein YidB (DUF937 family)